MTGYDWRARCAAFFVALAAATFAPHAEASNIYPGKFAPGAFEIGVQPDGLFSITGKSDVTINDKTDDLGDGTLPSAARTPAGGFALTTASAGDFLAWCVDVARFLDLGGKPLYEITRQPFATSTPITGARRADVKRLFDTAYDHVVASKNASRAAAFQLALWKLVADADRGMDVDNPAEDFWVSAWNGHVRDTAQRYLDNLQGPATGNYRLIFLESLQGGQNVITVAPVPLPAAGLLMLGALSGGAALYRRRQQRAATTA